MKQYCRYCSHLCAGNGIWCGAKEKEVAESTAKSANHCKQFEFCETDAFFETNGYKERFKKKTPPAFDDLSENQLRMEM